MGISQNDYMAKLHPTILIEDIQNCMQIVGISIVVLTYQIPQTRNGKMKADYKKMMEEKARSGGFMGLHDQASARHKRVSLDCHEDVLLVKDLLRQ